MSQRNPMNERYTTDDRKGQTRKSAASAKPKSKAASSVRVESTQKTPQQKKAAQKAQRNQQASMDRQYYNVPTPEYKFWRRVWWIFLVGALVVTALSFGMRMWFPEQETISFIVLGLAYVGIIGALVIDFTKIRKLRRAYQAEMMGTKAKETRALEKQQHAEQVAAKKAAEAAEKSGDAGSAEEKKPGVLGKLFGFQNLKAGAARANEANKEAAAASKAKASETAEDDASAEDDTEKTETGSKKKGKK